MNTVDLYIINIFNTNSGLLQFIEQTHVLENGGYYQKARVAALKLLYILLNNFPIRVEKYSSIISKACLTISCSFKTSSSEKDQAVKVLMLMLEKQLFSTNVEDIGQIFTKLFKLRSVDKGSTGLF